MGSPVFALRSFYRKALLVTLLLMLSSRCLGFLSCPSVRTPFVSSLHRLAMSTTSSTDTTTTKPFGVVVHTEIEPNRMAEFLTMIETNAVETRKEPECVRFDVLRSQEAPNQFIFYELYKSPKGMEHHKQQAHYQAWADFKESGGTLSAVTYKNDGEFVSL
jgi:autoinducer 2-degrading protein